MTSRQKVASPIKLYIHSMAKIEFPTSELYYDVLSTTMQLKRQIDLCKKWKEKQVYLNQNRVK